MTRSGTVRAMPPQRKKRVRVAPPPAPTPDRFSFERSADIIDSIDQFLADAAVVLAGRRATPPPDVIDEWKMRDWVH